MDKMGFSSQHYDSKSKNNCTMFIVPREVFKRKIDEDKLKYPCFYILLDKINKPSNCYVGYTNNPIERIATHRSKRKGKDFWHFALVFVYYDQKSDCHFDITDTAYLEYLAINEILEHLDSNNIPRSFFYNWKKADEPYIKPFAKDGIIKVFEDIKTIVSEYGLQLF